MNECLQGGQGEHVIVDGNRWTRETKEINRNNNIENEEKKTGSTSALLSE